MAARHPCLAYRRHPVPLSDVGTAYISLPVLLPNPPLQTLLRLSIASTCNANRRHCPHNLIPYCTPALISSVPTAGHKCTHPLLREMVCPGAALMAGNISFTWPLPPHTQACCHLPQDSGQHLCRNLIKAQCSSSSTILLHHQSLISQGVLALHLTHPCSNLSWFLSHPVTLGVVNCPETIAWTHRWLPALAPSPLLVTEILHVTAHAFVFKIACLL